MHQQHKPGAEFEKDVDTPPSKRLAGELWIFLKTNKKWWLLPIIIVLLLFGLLVLLSSTSLAPFIYGHS